MSKKKRKHYQVYEGLRCAMTLCFISGYVNAFTYMTQGKRFAGVQTGNLLSFAIRLSEQQLKEALQFLLPMIVFMLGQSFTYFMHRWATKKKAPLVPLIKRYVNRTCFWNSPIHAFSSFQCYGSSFSLFCLYSG